MMERPRMALAGGVLGISLIVVVTNVSAFKTSTHRELNSRAADISILEKDNYLRNQLGLSLGLDERFGKLEEAPSTRRVREWIREGGAVEDQFMESEALGALNRSRHHFHNPLLSWDRAGLSGRCFGIFPVDGQASVRWAQSLEEQAGGSARWSDARNRFRDALTLSSRPERDDAWANLFQILGQQMHLIADLAVPAHTRNDIHCTNNAEPFEVWAAGTIGLDLIPGVEPVAPSSAIFDLGAPAGESVASVPVARLWDSDLYIGTNPDATRLPLIGLSEYTNANFFSKDTVFSPNFPFPARTSVDPDGVFLDPKTGKLRRYLAKRRDGDSIERVAVTSSLDQFLPQDLKSKKVGFDGAVHAEYASKLFPRAVGYSAGLLGYFFRGKLDVDLVPADPEDELVVRLSGINASPDKLDGGSLTLYADVPGAIGPTTVVRRLVTALDQDLTVTAASGGNVDSARFRIPSDATRFMAVYRGKLGLEEPSGNSPGGVIGKAFDNTFRVEEVFSDARRWHLRTPEGVFPLPILAASDSNPTEIEDLRWGDVDNTLVGRTRLGPAAPNLFRAYEISRPVGSLDVPLRPDGTVDLKEPPREAAFPMGRSAGTRVEFQGTARFTQDLLTFDTKQDVFWDGEKYVIPDLLDPGGGGQSFSASEIQVEPRLVEQLLVNSEFDVTLDPVRYDGGPNLRPYVWRLREIGLDARGRILALVEVTLTQPEDNVRQVFARKHNRDTGDLEPAYLVALRVDFPVQTLLFAVVDVGAGQVVASTGDALFAPVVSSARADVIVQKHVAGIPHGGPVEGIAEFWDIAQIANAAVLPGPPPVTIGGAISTDFGVQAFDLPGQYRGDIAGPDAPLEISLSIRSATATSNFVYAILRGDPVNGVPPVYKAYTQTDTSSGVEGYITALRGAQRVRPGDRLEHLLLFGRRVGAGEGEEGVLLSWKAEQQQAAFAHDEEFPPAQQHTLAGATSKRAIVVSDFMSRLLDLDARKTLTFFEQNLADEFVLLDPTFLYNVQDQKFYRPLPFRRTALPPALAPAANNPVGDYHAVRLR